MMKSYNVTVTNGYRYIDPIDILPGSRAVHLSTAFTQSHTYIAFFQPQWISSWHASEVVVHSGSHPVVFFFHPQLAGSGSFCIVVRAFFQQMDWYLACLMCCLSTS